MVKVLSKTTLWDSHNRWTSGKTRALRHSCTACLDLLLQCRHWVCFHHGLCWLGLNLDIFAKDVPDTSFCGWLCAGLEPAETWNREDSILLHLCGCNGHQAVDHGFSASLHGLGLHRWQHCWSKQESQATENS